MPPVAINYLAVLGGALANMVLGFIWYGPLFGKEWVKLMGFSEAKMNEMKKKGMEKMYAFVFVGSLVTAYVLAHFVDYTGASSATSGMETGFWTWLGFVATTQLSGFLWEGKPFKLYALNIGYNLVSLTVMGAILAIWV